MGLRLLVVALFTLAVAQPARQSGPRVDHHQHLFSPAATKLSSGVEPLTASDLVALLDLAGIRRAVVLSLAYQFGNPNKPVVENEYAHVKAENDWTSQQVAQFPDRLRGFCSINPLRTYALEEVARCANDPHIRYGLKLHFGNSDVDLENQEHIAQLRRIFGAANGHGMAIVVHLRSTISKGRPYGANQAGVFLNEVLPTAPDVPVQIAHLAGAGGYDDPLVDQALTVFTDAVAKKDPRMTRVYFDVSGVAGLGNWEDKAALIATRIRQLGVDRVLYGSDGAVGGNLAPREAWAAFRKVPLSDAEFRTIENNVAPYLR
jgi:predicted TIM-barrel fold metal-dependent hydrolase